MAGRARTRQAVPSFGKMVDKSYFCVAAAAAMANEKLKSKLNFLHKKYFMNLIYNFLLSLT
jgi:hypothetical protein